MDYKVLYRKYRPDDFSNIIGQDYIVSILKNAISKNKISHAYIFSGPRGTGKTSTAKVFSKAINCLNPTENGPCNNCESCIRFKENADIIEIDAASNNGVDEIRELINNIKLAPAYSKYKVYIIDEVHMLSTSAFNALLLTLEEPPKHIVFILATTNIEAVPITILSRTQRFDFRKISIEDIINRLRIIVTKEKIEIEEEALKEIAYISDGGLRDALSILDQLSSSSSQITLNDVISHFKTVSKKQVNDLFTCVTANNIDELVSIMENFSRLAIDYKLLIRKLLEKIEEEAINSKIKVEYNGLSYEQLKEMAFELASISNYVNININPYLLIEITLLKYINHEQPTKKIISREIILPSENLKMEEKYNEIIKVRVNNCFVNAKKEYLQNIKSIWNNFISSLEDKNLINLLIDSNIVASSDKIAILTNQAEGTVSLINENLENIDKEFQKKNGLDYKFIALTDEQWNKEKQNYINNTKNKVEYIWIEEKQNEPPKTEQEIANIEKTAFNIFDKDKIEYE